MTNGDACTVIISCLQGTSREIIHAACLTTSNLSKDLELLKQKLMKTFMGDLTLFDMKMRAWKMKQRDDESAEEFGARVKDRLHNNALKEVLDMPEHKKLVAEGGYANNFSRGDIVH